MNFFMNEENVNKYYSMLDGYDPKFILDELAKHATPGSKLLELGMGTGLEFDILSNKYDALGTDNSPIFIDKYLAKHPNANVRILDATNITIDTKFDLIYSNKVLQHLTRTDFVESLQSQYDILNDDGIIFMTLWHGDYQEIYLADDTLRITYFSENDILDIVSKQYKVKEIKRYTELEDNDSIIVVLKKQ